MAANTETVSIDTVKKSLWDNIEALWKNISGETLATLLEMIESGGGAKPLEVNATVSENAQNKQVITQDVTAEEVFFAAEAGKMIKVATSVPYSEDVTLHQTIILPIEVFRSEVGEDVYYIIKARADITATDQLFYAENLSGDDTVVLTEV